jgi:hypothetical protein
MARFARLMPLLLLALAALPVLVACGSKGGGY